MDFSEEATSASVSGTREAQKELTQVILEDTLEVYAELIRNFGHLLKQEKNKGNCKIFMKKRRTFLKIRQTKQFKQNNH